MERGEAGDKRLVPGTIRQIATAVAAYALPPRCPGCGVPVDADGRFCAVCWRGLRFIGPPWCSTCLRPFVYATTADQRCPACWSRPPRHAGVRAAVAYGETARTMALGLKYGGRLGLAETLARLMARHMPADAALIVPVPLHRWRLWRRGYNQAALIGAALALARGVPFLPDAIVRTRATPALKAMDARARSAAVRGAFAVTATGRTTVAGRPVVLVDDVHTSGATVGACADVLLDAGAARVDVLCWARVLDDD